MSQNFYTTQKMAETHRYELMREAEQQRLVAELPRQRNSIATKFGMFLTMLSTNLKKLGQTTMSKPAPTSSPLFLESPHH